MPNIVISEDVFSTLLKRIERQYTGSRNGRNAWSHLSTRQEWTQRPPDESAYALGKGLARSFLDLCASATSPTISNGVQEELFILFANRDVNPAVCQGFFENLLQPNEKGRFMDLDAFFPACILLTEQNEVKRQSSYLEEDDSVGTHFDPLTSMIRSYADYTCKKFISDRNSSFALLDDTSSSSHIGLIAKAYSKLRTQAARLAMLRDFTDVAFEAGRTSNGSQTVYRYMLNPLLACSVLSSKTGRSDGGDSSMVESVLCMEGIWRQIYSLVEDVPTAKEDDCVSLYTLMDAIEWLTEMLNLFLLSIPGHKRHLKIPCKELAHRWLSVVLDVGVFLAQSLEGDNNKQLQRSIVDWFDNILSKSLLRWFAAVPSYRIRMHPFWSSLRKLMALYGSKCMLSLESTLKLATICICHPVKEDVKEILGLFALAVENSQLLHPICFSILKGLGLIFSTDEICAANTKNLLYALLQTNQTENKITTSERSTAVLVNMIQLFEDGNSTDAIMSYFLPNDNEVFDHNRAFTPIQQAGSLVLYGIGLLNEGTDHHLTPYAVLRKLLLAYPHLGITFLPVIVNRINTAAVRGVGCFMMEQIELLADVVVRHPQCAREIWNLLGKEFMREGVPAIIRSSIIRFYPKICQGNKKLYKRVIESMGNTLVNSNSNDGNDNDNLEIRLAIAASTSDLARDDLIRDPTDIISWLQEFITDTGWVRSVSTMHLQKDDHGKAAVAHFSIQALHFLVIAQELDFKLVLVVLRKKLCDVHNLDEISKLPPIVLESLIILLGDGESDEDDSSDDDDDCLKAIGIPSQTSRSVETLIGLWNHNCLKSEHFSDPTVKATIFRCKRNVLKSLARYSFEALGLDEEGVQNAIAAFSSEDNEKSHRITPGGSRYNALNYLVSDGIAFLSTLNRHNRIRSTDFQGDLNSDIVTDFSVTLSTFISKIMKFEEDTLGSTLWQKRQSAGQRERKPKSKRKGSSHSSKLSEALPSPKSVLDIYEEQRCQASSLGALSSFEEISKSLLFDLATDVTSDPSDAIFQTIYVQSWLNAARSLLNHLISQRSISKSLENLLNDIEEWRSHNSDSMFMMLSSIAILIPTVLGPYGDFSSYMQDISKEVWEAYNSRMFEDSDVAKLCLGFVGICDLSLGNCDRLLQIVRILEKTATGYGGLPSFGAYYALACMAKRCATSGRNEAIYAKANTDLSKIAGRILIFLINELSKCIKGTNVAIGILTTAIRNEMINPEETESLNDLKGESIKFNESKRRTSRALFIALGICLPMVTKSNDRLLPPIISFLESLEWGYGVGLCVGPVLRACHESRILDDKGMKQKIDAYSKIFKEGIDRGINVLHDILYALTTLQSKSASHSIEKIRMTEEEGARWSMSIVIAVSSIAFIPCLGHGIFITDSPCLKDDVNDAVIADLVQFLSEENADMAIVMRGFLASLANFNGSKDSSRIDAEERLSGTKLPEAHFGTASEILMSSLRIYINNQDEIGLVPLLKCLEAIALPDQFSVLVETLVKGEESTKTACMKLLVSQISGRPRAVFDGRDFIKLALKICKMPVMSIQSILGNTEAAEIFIDSFGEMLTKFISQEVETVIENVFQFCISQVDQNYNLIISLLQSIKLILQQAEKDKSPRFSPKCLNSINLFLQRKSFSAIHDATSNETMNVPPNQITRIVDAYADCIVFIPESLLIENNNQLFDTPDDIGFAGEVLRVRVMMNLIRNGRCSFFSHSYQEVASSMAWLSQQVIACREGALSPALLHVACAIAEASSKEAADKKRDILVSYLDNLLMVDSRARFVSLEILSALVFQWCQGSASDGDLSLLQTLGPSVEKWVDLRPEVTKKIFQIAVHDLPFNLAKFARDGNLSGVIFNRLWRIYTKWLHQGTDESTLTALRLSLLCCRDMETVTNPTDMTILVNSLV